MKKEKRTDLLLHIIYRLHKTIGKCSDSHLQLLVYLMNIKYGNIFGYKFTLYDYGPYTFDLEKDIKFMKGCRTVFNEVNKDGYTYDLIVNRKIKYVDEIINKETKYDNEIDGVVKEFDNNPIKTLSLLGAFHYIANKPKNDYDLICGVERLKPLFSKEELQEGLKHFKLHGKEIK